VRAVVSICLGATISVGCRGEKDEARRAEAGRITEAVRKLREAPNRAKEPFLLALRSTSCATDDGCELKKTCTDAYLLEQQALDGISAVRRETTGGAPAEPVPSAAAALLSRVTLDLERAKTLAKNCADLEGAARRKYSL